MSRSAKGPVSGGHSVRVTRAGALLAPLAALVLLAGQPAFAQPVVQPIPDPAAARLADALQSLARNPQSVDALIAAGDASLRLDDLEAALGFYNRASAIAPSDGRAKAGLASIHVRREQPVEALRLFAEAEQSGASLAAYSADRGLAFDLVGDNASAQAAYMLALSQGPDDTVSRRLAISQAISGNRAGAEATLLPLLQRQDLAAFRARAFALAILGDEDEAVSIVETMLPARLAGRMGPYLRYMTRLTHAQQAAAANLGRFPRAAEIGRDDPSIAALAASGSQATPTQVAAARGADARLVPSGAPMGSRRPAQGTETPAPAAAQPAPAPAAAGELPALDGAPTAAQPVVQPIPSRAAEPVRQASPAPAAPEVQSRPPVQGPALASGEPPASPGALAPVAAAPPADASPAPMRSEADLAAAFADIAQAPRPQPTAAGAVDITSIKPRRETPRPPPPPPPPPSPSREWVQLATGRDTAALGFDWRRIRRKAGGLLDNTKPHLAAWGDRTRLLAGPFSSASQAQELVAALAESEVDSFRFTSAQGEEVRPLD